MDVKEVHASISHLAFTEPDFDRTWLTEDYLSSCSPLSSVGSPGQTDSYSFDDRYVYDLWRWKKSFWRGYFRSDGWKTFGLLTELYKAGLPVPRPLAVEVDKRGVFGGSRMLTYRIADAEVLSEVLKTRAIPDFIWEQVGALLRQLHDLKVSLKGLCVDDFVLNGQGKLFMRRVQKLARNDSKKTAWKQSELQSLLTSILSLRESSNTCFFDDSDWLAVTQAYLTRAKLDLREA